MSCLAPVITPWRNCVKKISQQVEINILREGSCSVVCSKKGRDLEGLKRRMLGTADTTKCSHIGNHCSKFEAEIGNTE